MSLNGSSSNGATFSQTLDLLMKIVFPRIEFGDQIDAAFPSKDVLRVLLSRRSVPAKMMKPPGPSASELEVILASGARVPDHRGVVPFRFITCRGDAREQLGELLALIYQADNPMTDIENVEVERARFLRSPLSVIVVSSVDAHHKTPEWEQILTAGAVCQNMLLAGSALGYAGQWLTEWYSYHPDFLRALDLSDTERIAGVMHFGTASQLPRERRRPNLKAIVTTFGSDHEL